MAVAWAPGPVPAQTLTPDQAPKPAPGHAPAPAKPAPGPFGLSPETMAKAARIAEQIRAATQAAAASAARQVADRFPKTSPATAPAPAPTAAPVATPAPPAASQPAGAVAAGPPPLRGPQGPPPNGVDWRLASVDQRRSADVGPRAVEGLRLNPAAVNRTALPILLLRGALIDGARLYSFGDYYSVTADMLGARISLTGATLASTAHLSPATPLAASPEAEQMVVQRTVDGQLASFVRYGVLYTVELRCDAPDDGRCKTDAVVRDLVARSTVVVFGKAARQAAGLGG